DSGNSCLAESNSESDSGNSCVAESNSEIDCENICSADCNFENESENTVNLDNLDTSQFDCSLTDELRRWALLNKVSHLATTSLLKLLKPHHSELPVDARTLLKTPRRINISRRVDPGQYIHIGLEEGLIDLCCDITVNFGPSQCQNISSVPDILEIVIGVDGLPIGKSNNKGFWPILCKVRNIPNSQPFAVGLFFGMSKPNFSNDFFRYFVEGFKYLYGEQYMSYYIQGLLHLASDAHHFGHLDSFSAFPFENFMQIFKQQIIKRLAELKQLQKVPIHLKEDLICKYEHGEGPVVEGFGHPQFSRVEFPTFTLIKQKGNNCCGIIKSL
uniref:Uncharacterized protein n=1 Tax=Strigamia maritima TaxID=126957 RepID=T1IVZ4_STRMM